MGTVCTTLSWSTQGPEIDRKIVALITKIAGYHGLKVDEQNYARVYGNLTSFCISWNDVVVCR